MCAFRVGWNAERELITNQHEVVTWRAHARSRYDPRSVQGRSENVIPELARDTIAKVIIFKVMICTVCFETRSFHNIIIIIIIKKNKKIDNTY